MYRPIFPPYIHNEVEKMKFSTEFQRRIETFGPKNPNKEEWEKIYCEKDISGELFDHMSRNNPPDQSPYVKPYDPFHKTEKYQYDGSIFLVQKNIAEIYLALLAEYLANIETTLTIPVTTQDHCANYAFSSIDPSPENVCANLILTDILPMPEPNYPIEDLIQFKNDHRSELLKFRGAMDDFQKSISISPDRRDMQYLSTKFQEEIQSNVLDIKDHLEDNRIQVLLGSVNVLLDLKNPSILQTLIDAGLICSTLINPIIGGTFLALNSLVKLGCYFHKEKTERKSFLKDQPYSYIYHLEKKFN